MALSHRTFWCRFVLCLEWLGRLTRMATATDCITARIAVYFSPGGGTTDAVGRALNTATTQVVICHIGVPLRHERFATGPAREKPFKIGSKRVALEVKSVTKTPSPESYQVLWEESVTERHAPTIKTQRWTGTFTVGRVTLTTMDDLLDNRLGICINGFDLSPQS